MLTSSFPTETCLLVVPKVPEKRLGLGHVQEMQAVIIITIFIIITSPVLWLFLASSILLVHSRNFSLSQEYLLLALSLALSILLNSVTKILQGSVSGP